MCLTGCDTPFMNKFQLFNMREEEVSAVCNLPDMLLLVTVLQSLLLLLWLSELLFYSISITSAEVTLCIACLILWKSSFSSFLFCDFSKVSKVQRWSNFYTFLLLHCAPATTKFPHWRDPWWRQYMWPVAEKDKFNSAANSTGLSQKRS